MDLPAKLKENEYLLKIEPSGEWRHYTVGFMTKYTQKGEIPKSFDNWGTIWPALSRTQVKPEEVKRLPITVHVEEFRFGWKVMDWRFGKSQNWAVMLHPMGFTVEIYLKNLLKLIKSGVINEGVLEGEYMWKDHELIKKEND